MVRYVKDGAYTIKVEDADLVDANGRELDDSELLEAARQAEAVKEIDFTDTDFILQNLTIAEPSYKDDRTYMLVGRKDLIEIICSQVCFLCYCALLGLETKTANMSILVIGDGFVGGNLIAALKSHGFGDYIKLYTRSDSRAKEWTENGVRANSSIMDLLAGQRPDIIIPCVENASFTAICKHFNEFNIVTESTFIITPTFGFQRKKMYNALRCFSVFRTYVEPHEIVRNHKMKTRSNKMDLLSMLLRGEVPMDALKDDEDKSPESSAQPSPTRTPSAPLRSSFLNSRGSEKGEAKTVMWGDEFEGEVVDPDALIEGLDETGPEDADHDPESVNARGARYLISRLHNVRNFVYLLENFYFIHGMMHHEARQSALNVIFGYRESAGEPIIQVNKDEEEGSLISGSIVSATPFSDAPGTPLVSTPSQRSISTPNGSVTVSSVATPPPSGYVKPPPFPVEVHNLLRREKMPKRVRAHFEHLLDESLNSVGKSYQREFSKQISIGELREMYRDYPPDHQRQLDQKSFLQNHRSMSIVGIDGLRHVARHDKHSRTMYDESFILDSIFGKDDDITGFSGPGFDYIQELEKQARKPKRGLSKSRSYQDHITTASSRNDDDEGDIAVPDYEHDDRHTISEEMAQVIKQMHKQELHDAHNIHAHHDENGLNEDSIGKRMFRKHSEFSKDLHVKLAHEATGMQRHHSFVPPA